MTVRIINADVMEGLRQLPDESVHCVVCSPPYWGLRDYGTAIWNGGDADCAHELTNTKRTPWANAVPGPNGISKNTAAGHWKPKETGGECAKCGAVKVDYQIGLEPTLGEHIERLVSVFREVRRVLRSDGTLWMNYGDCYATAPNGRSAADTKAAGNDDRTFRDKPFSTVGPIYDPLGGAKGGGHRGTNKSNSSHDATPTGRVCAGGTLKAKDLCMIPHRLAIALQDDGWWVRADVVWAKPNPMPESIKDRPTKSHEYVFLLTKSERYFYDAEAIREPAGEDVGPGVGGWAAGADHTSVGHARSGTVAHGDTVKRRKTKIPGGWDTGDGAHGTRHRDGRTSAEYQETDSRPGRNKRSVWTIATAPFPEAHFATFPPELPEICIKAGCPVGGTVLDPFSGAGTTCLVADRLQRDAIGIELNETYAEMSRRRIDGDRGGLLDIMEAAE